MQQNIFDYTEKEKKTDAIFKRIEDLDFEEQMNYLNNKLTKRERMIIYGEELDRG